MTVEKASSALLSHALNIRDVFSGKLGMALHRDIFWLGRQWAVTGYGIQALNKKLEGKFDVETSRLGEDVLAEPMLPEPWFDLDDFKEALEVARKRLQETPAIFRPSRPGEK